MGINIELAKKAEGIARKMAKKSGQPESLWKLFLPDAYDRILVDGIGEEEFNRSKEDPSDRCR